VKDAAETVTALIEVTEVDHLILFERGNRLFSKMFTYWMDTNNWSHPVMVNLAKSCLNGRSWLHSSQIAGLRHCNLHSPGPRTFIAIERLNYYIHRYKEHKLLIPGTDSSINYAEAFSITENGSPPPLGWWVEVFVGQRVPQDLTLDTYLFTDKQVAEISDKVGALIRRLLISKNLDLITQLDKTLWHNYPVREPDRVTKLSDVIHAKGSWSTDELVREIPALVRLFTNLGGPTTEHDLMKVLKE
jgi:hypothetical protein